MSYQSPEALREIQALVIDMDGVLWRGDEPLPGLVEFFELLRGWPIAFRMATNNASKSPHQYVDKLASMGVRVSPDEILTSAVVTAQHIAAVAPGASVYAIGDGTRQAMLDYGLRLSDGQQADFVAVGWDPKITYKELSEATLLIHAGARFIGTNPDRTLPTERGLLPGNGAILACLQAATGVEPFIIGKPEPAMFEAALTVMGADPAHTAVLGDRLETDISGGQNAGLRTIFVLSGANGQADLAASPVKPDWVFRDIQELTQIWSALQR
ncbi:MAG: HAD-IIA family hydrolase [Anaerolineae bacterium]